MTKKILIGGAVVAWVLLLVYISRQEYHPHHSPRLPHWGSPPGTTD